MGSFSNSYSNSFEVAGVTPPTPGEWLTVNPLAGSNNGTLALTALPNTGRNPRSKQLRVYSLTPALEDFYTVSQAGKPEFLTVLAINVDKDATVVNIPFTSNTSKINSISAGSGSILGTLPSTYSANGSPATFGTAIPGDPGATAQFDGIISIPCSANAGSGERTQTLTITLNSGATIQVVITQEGSDADILVSPTLLGLVAAGTAQNVNVTSNTTWSVD